MTVESIMSCRTLWKIIFTGMVCSQRHDRGFFIFKKGSVSVTAQMYDHSHEIWVTEC